MVYANDRALQMPVADLYDTQMMAMAINAAKDMYEKGLQLIKDFNKEYGDFMSPFAKDMARYNEMVGGVRDTINNLYALGIDPLRSAEGRAAVQRAIQLVNPSEFNNMRANAKMGYAYLDAMGKLMASGKYDPEQNAYYLESQNMPSFDDFSSANGATWKLSSPVEATTLRDFTMPGFQHIKPRTLTPEQAAKELGSQYNPNKEYQGIIEDHLMDVATNTMPGLKGSYLDNYFRNLALKEVLAKQPHLANPDLKEILQEETNKQYQRNIANSQRQWLTGPEGDYDKVWLEKYKSNLDMGAYRLKRLIDAYYDGLKENEKAVKIFREGEAIAKENKAASAPIGYDPNESYYQYMNPVESTIESIVTKDGHRAFRIRNNKLNNGKGTKNNLNGVVYTEASLNSPTGKLTASNVKIDKDAIFEQTGVFRTKYIGKDKNGKKLYRHFIGGTLMVPELDDTGKQKVDASKNPIMRTVRSDVGNNTFYIEVDERAFNYGQKLKTSY